MRAILSISLPDTIKEEIEEEVRGGRFSSVSEVVRHVWREYKVREEVRHSRDAIARGRGKTLRSLKDLR